ncbi:hypothetical protein [Deinococcus hopiensis]|uniref:Uncharacterized protein n=1 Tax=Deinococcus hopiensis KR-140 TaxID=695939 RepID=A0A1W1UZI8_9DEIO|nr:hypothetical protein [Deinococcus hopiensis]SMB86489.1 hypothetical protein SAMN00790413_03827 [Deinococcus hopiensis KR-140]
MQTTTAPPPHSSSPLLTGVDWTAFIWALVFSLTLLPSRHRWELKKGQVPTPWWVVILETLVGGLVGGVGFATAAPEVWPGLRGPGKQAMLAIGGAAVGPLLGKWIPAGIAAAIGFFSEKKLGFRIEVQPREPDPPQVSPPPQDPATPPPTAPVPSPGAGGGDNGNTTP